MLGEQDLICLVLGHQEPVCELPNELKAILYMLGGQELGCYCQGLMKYFQRAIRCVDLLYTCWESRS